MIDGLSRWMESFADLKVLVIGEAMLDSYLEGTTGRLCREAPVPVVNLLRRADVPGGAGNTAVNVRSLGAQVTFLSVTGDDLEGKILRQALEDRGVSARSLLARPGRRTLAKHRVVAASQLLVRFDQGSVGPLDESTERQLIRRLLDYFPACDAVIVSDYGYGILTPRVIQCLADLQAMLPRILVVDSKRLTEYRSLHVTAVKPNYSEVLHLLGNRACPPPDARAEILARHGDEILEATGARVAAVTLDTDGSLVFERGRDPYRTYAKPRRHAQAAGAGDTFVAALTLSLAAGADTPSAAELASAAAAVVVSKDGTACCTWEELRDQTFVPDKRLSDRNRLAARIEAYRQQGRRIVLTNGCFDILHRGHITYLNHAKSLGDVLIVGVNSDASIRRLKGPDRPINSAEDRVQVLEALSCIDHITVFDEDDPCKLIEAVRPDVFVKGGDYSREMLPEAALVEQLGGTVQILPYVQDRSTTRLIQRIRAIPTPMLRRPEELPHGAQSTDSRLATSEELIVRSA